MKKRYLPLLISSLLASATLTADVATLGECAFLQQVAIKENATSETIARPFGINMHGYAIGKANMDKGTPGNIKYAEAEVDLMATQKLSCYEGISEIVGVDEVYMNWNDNPFFERTNFESVDVGLLGYSTRAPGWLWQVGIAAQISLNYDGIGRYTRYSSIMWGRYELTDTFGVHTGLYAFYNLRRNKVFPIIGFDWTPTPSWKFNMIFPLNISANYIINPMWSVGLGWMPFWSRHRVGKNEVDTKGIWENRNNGAELVLNFNTPVVIACLYVGQAFGGTLKIMDKNGNHPQYFKYKSAPYLGFRAMAPF